MTSDAPTPSPAAPLPSGGGRLAALHSRSASVLFALFLGSTVIAPAAPLNKLLFILIFMRMSWEQFRRRAPNPFPSLSPLTIIAIFMYGFALALVNDVDMAIAVQLLFSTLALTVVYFIAAHDIDMDRMVVGASLLLVASTALFWLTLLLPDAPLAPEIGKFFFNFNFSSTSERDFFAGGVTSTLQLGTAPFLFAGYCVVGMRLLSPARHRWDGLNMALIGAGIVVSGLRGLIGISLLYTAYLTIRATRPRHRWLVVLAIVALAASAWSALLASSQVFSIEEESNSVKIGHFVSFLHELSWLSGLFGRGLANYYYSSGSHAMKAYTELSPIDMCRWIGIPLTAVLYAVLLFPLRGPWRYARCQGGYTIAMLLYTATSMTNPVMFNSYGLEIVIWYWCSLKPRQPASRPPAGSKA